MDQSLETPPEGPDAINPTPLEPTPDETPMAARPDIVPEKFWNADEGEVRVEAMAKSYAELERKLGSQNPTDAPDTPDGYQMSADGLIIGADAQVNARLHEAGFSQAQAQLVYELANEYLPQMAQDLAGHYGLRQEETALAEHFGGDDRWQEVSRQLSTWGRSNLPADVLESLSGTREGIIAMERMMSSGEPSLISGDAAGAAGLSEDSLKEMMRDPRYWRDHDPAVVGKVRDGFKKLFPGKG